LFYALHIIAGPALFNFQIAVFYPAEFAKLTTERGKAPGNIRIAFSARHEDAEFRNTLMLLRA
jgi:hypothetical protein